MSASLAIATILTRDTFGREYAKLSALQDGQHVILDTGFTCHKSGLTQVHKNYKGEFFFKCKCGTHFLDGQLADDGDHLIGVYPIRRLAAIAATIQRDWKNVNYAAKPYLATMARLGSMGDAYGLDSARSIVLYFLANASSWRGPVAKQTRSELKAMLELPV